MIGRLSGRVAEKQPPHLLLDVHGVGYELQAPLSTFAALPAEGETITLHTHLISRDDGITLFGFADAAERTLFRALIRVSGVGPRLALTLLSGLGVRELHHCLETQDARRLTRVPGVGRKTAERLVVEMQDRVADLGTGAAPDAAAATAEGGSNADEAVNALLALGYKPAEANRLVAAVTEPGLGSEALIRLALQRSVQ